MPCKIAVSRLAKVFFVLGLSVLVACSGGEERQAAYLEQAQIYYDEEDYESALIDVKNALQINPNNAQGRYLYGLIELKEGNFGKGYGNLSMAVDFDPTHVDALVLLGQMNLMAGNLEEANRRIEAALELAPDNADAMGALALVRLREGEREEAEKYAEAALQLNPAQADALSAIAAYYVKSDPEMVLARLNKGIELEPDNLKLRETRLKMYVNLERTEEAIAETKAVLDYAPEKLHYVNMLALYMSRIGMEEEAEAFLLENMNERPEDVQLKILYVQFVVRQRGPEAGIEKLEELLAQNDEEIELRGALGELYLRSERVEDARELFLETFDYDLDGSASQIARNKLAGIALAENDQAEALRWIEEVLEIEPENPAALISRARIMLHEGDSKQAVVDLRVALRIEPDSVPARLLLAEAQAKDGASSLALDNYRKVLQVNPGNKVALFQSARLLIAQELYDEASASLVKLLRIEPSNLLAISLLADIYTVQERWDDAVEVADRLSANDKTRPVADFMKGSLALRQGKFAEAEEYSLAALAANDDLIGAMRVVALSKASQDDTAGAVASVSSYLERHEDSWQAHELLGRMLLADNQIIKGTESYERALELAPEQESLYLNLARLYRIGGDKKKVEALLTKGVESNPHNLGLRIELANLYQRAGKLELALAQLEAAHAEDPRSPIVSNNLAALLIDRFPSGQNLRRAQELTLDFERANNPAQLDTVGWLQYKLGNLAQAIDLLKRAQSKGGRGPEYWYHLGMAYYSNNQNELAKEQLALALENDKAEFYGRSEAQKIYNEL